MQRRHPLEQGARRDIAERVEQSVQEAFHATHLLDRDGRGPRSEEHNWAHRSLPRHRRKTGSRIDQEVCSPLVVKSGSICAAQRPRFHLRDATDVGQSFSLRESPCLAHAAHHYAAD